jgi:UDP-glucose 4-epimerase
VQHNKILVTGGAGYIGSHTVIELLEAGYQPVSIDNFSNAPRDTFERIFQITGKRIENADINLCDSTLVHDWFAAHSPISGIIHFAALKAVGESVEQPLRYYRNNIDSLLTVLDCAEKYRIPAFIFSSSCSVYGNVSRLPVDERTPLAEAESPYAFTKVCGERIVKDTSAVSGVNAVLLRYFNPVGAHSSGLLGEYPIHKPNNLIPVITQAACGKIPPMQIHGVDYATRDGSCIRDYVHVSDIARAHVQALQFIESQSKMHICEVFNLGSGKGVSVHEAIHAFEENTGQKVPYSKGPRRPGDVEAIYSDSTKAQKYLGWYPLFNLQDMMNTAWKWQQQLNHEGN